MPGLNLSLGSTDLDTWRSGLWTCENGHVIESENEPDHECYRYGSDEWTECVLAARYPREGEWGIIKCGRCGDEQPGLNSPKLASWVCNECLGDILPRSTRVRFEDSADSTETEQTALPIAATDGGRQRETDTDRPEVDR